MGRVGWLVFCAVVMGSCGSDRVSGPSPSGDQPSPVSPTPRPARLAALTFDRLSITGGQQARATVQLTGPAPDGGLAVTLASSGEMLAPPATVMVPAGQVATTVPIDSKVTPTDTNVTLTASADGVIQTAKIDVVAIALLDVLDTAVRQKYLYAGAGGAIRGTLKEHATSVTIVELRSSNPAVLEPSGLMQFGPGTVQQQVGLVAKPVADDTPVTITATSGGQTRQLEFVVTAPPFIRVITESGTQTQTSPTAFFFMNARASCGGREIHLSVQAPGGFFWLFDMYAPNGSVIKPGTYVATSDQYDTSRPRVYASANWASCLSPTGRFVVDLADYDTTLPSARIGRFRGVIEMSCPNNRNLRAEISLNDPGFTRVGDSCS